MLKFLFDVLQLAIVIKLGYLGLRRLFFRKKKYRKKSIARKVYQLINNRIHYKLNAMLKKQKEALYPSKTSDGKVVPFKKTK